MNSQKLPSPGVLLRACASLVALSSFVLSGCVSSRSLAPADNGAVRPTFEQGIAVLKSEKQNTVVVRLLTSEFTNETGGFPALYVAMFNGTDAELDFSTTNVVAFSGEAKVHVYTFEEMQKRIKREAAMMAFATAMNSASQSMAASMPQHSYTSGTASAYGSGGYATANYSSNTTTYNPAATATAQAQINANSAAQMSMIASARDAQLNNTNDMLRRNTVPPGSTAGGVIKLKATDIKDGQPLRLTVTLGSEQHEFLFRAGE